MPSNVKASVASRNARLSTVISRLETGGAPKIRFYTAPQPASADVAVTTQTLLVTCVMSADSFADPANGVAVANAIAAGNPVADGQLAWGRLESGSGVAEVDVAAGVAASTPDLVVGSTNVNIGVPVTPTSLTLSQA